MKWMELSIRAPSEFVEPLVYIFQRYGHSGVAIEEDGGFDPDDTTTPAPSPVSVILRTYLPMGTRYKSRKAMIDVGIRLVSLIHPLGSPQERVLKESEWEDAWKEHFTLLKIGQRTVVRPPWESYSPERNEVTIELDPGMAFGTGHHPTTRMCLEELEVLIQPKQTVLDVGTGSGILAIAASKLGASSVLAMDIDKISTRVARRNIRVNGVVRGIKVLQGNITETGKITNVFSIVIANINAKIISQNAKNLTALMAPGAILLASGIILEHLYETKEALSVAGLKVVRQHQDGDWFTLVMRN
jgi:ribosomal protein L11 methyltransferase